MLPHVLEPLHLLIFAVPTCCYQHKTIPFSQPFYQVGFMVAQITAKWEEVSTFKMILDQLTFGTLERTFGKSNALLHLSLTVIRRNVLLFIVFQLLSIQQRKSKPRVLVLPKTAVRKPLQNTGTLQYPAQNNSGISSLLQKRVFHTSQKFRAVFFLLPLFFVSSALAEDLQGQKF